MRPVGVAFAAVALAAGTAAAQPSLPEGPGKAIVEGACVQCHGLDNIIRSGYSRSEWRTRVAMMVNVGAKLAPGDVDTVVDYLARRFPERAAPSPALLAGDAKVDIREWTVPTAGSRPHDPLATRDGALWYTGQFANVLGRLDPATGRIREFHLPTENSGPHGLVEDRDGNVWFTANFKAYIGKLDPATGKVTEYPMPDAAARDPHTLVFDGDGILWFTVQSGNFVGRLDPKTGEVKLVRSPTPRSRPYGMRVDASGVPWFVEFGANKVARIDPHTLAIREYELPDRESRPRRLAITRDGAIWFTDFSRGALGRLAPATGKVTEWPSPSGAHSEPYGILADGDVLWYSESAVKPNTLVRFDPRSAKFQSWAIPSGGGVVRHMMLAPDGKLALALSGVDGVALVEKR
jgi:virginiamycin B lyase